MKKMISFILILASVMLLGVSSQFLRGQTIPLLLCMVGAVLLFICGLVIHKRAA